MSGIVHFKFKSSNSYDSVSFDGAFVSVSELKVLIAEKKGLSKDATSELLLSDPRTQADYEDDSAVIPKSSSVLVRRVPNLHPALLQQQQQKPAPTSATAEPPAQAASAEGEPITEPQPSGEVGDDDFGGELYTEQKDEDQALTQLLAETGQQWEKEVRQGAVRGRGRGRLGFRGRGGFPSGRGREAPPVLPKGYICFRCGQTGHHISECPSSADPDTKRIRPAIGVPTALLAKSTAGGLLLPDGTTGSLQPNEDAFLKEIGGAPGAASQPPTEEAGAGADAAPKASEGEPMLAGSAELSLPFGGLLMPPDAGGPWEPPLPHLPLPGMPEDLLQNAPLSREEFKRMQEQLTRKQERSRREHSVSPVRSRRDDRRRSARESRSPRRQDSPRRSHRGSRRHRSRDRSSSSERRPAHRARRTSPMPSFIQLRKRSSSPRSRRQRHARSPSPAALGRHRHSSQSPPRRRQRDGTRWRPDEEGPSADRASGDGRGRSGELAAPPEFADRFDEAWQQGSAPPPGPAAQSQQQAAAPDFSVPELMGDPGAALAFESPRPAKPGSLPPARKSKPLGLGAPLTRLQRGVGSRWKAEDVEGGGAAGTQGNGQPDGSEPAKALREEAQTGDRRDKAAVGAAAEERAADTEAGAALPKTFSVTLEPEARKERKPKKQKKEKSKRSKSSPAPRDLEPREGRLPSGMEVSANAAGPTVRAADGRDASDTAAEGTAGNGPSPNAAGRRYVEDSAIRPKASPQPSASLQGAGAKDLPSLLGETSAKTASSERSKHKSHKHKEHKHRHSKKRIKSD